MPIKTSYWGAKPSGNVIAVCQMVPKGWQGRRLRELVPRYNLRDPNWRELYRDQLEALPESFWATVPEMLGPDPILVCWEKDLNQCHRQLLADFLAEKGFEVVPESLRDSPAQASLF